MFAPFIPWVFSSGDEWGMVITGYKETKQFSFKKVFILDFQYIFWPFPGWHLLCSKQSSRLSKEFALSNRTFDMLPPWIDEILEMIHWHKTFIFTFLFPHHSIALFWRYENTILHRLTFCSLPSKETNQSSSCSQAFLNAPMAAAEDISRSTVTNE